MLPMHGFLVVWSAEGARDAEGVDRIRLRRSWGVIVQM